MDVLRLLGHRVSEINVWVGANIVVTLALFFLAVPFLWKGLRESALETWVTIAFIALVWGSFQVPIQYYIRVNAVQAYRLEQQLPLPALGHEHQREQEKRNDDSKYAPLGYALPFILLFAFSLVKLVRDHRADYGILWAVVLIVILGMIVGLALVTKRLQV